MTDYRKLFDLDRQNGGRSGRRLRHRKSSAATLAGLGASSFAPTAISRDARRPPAGIRASWRRGRGDHGRRGEQRRGRALADSVKAKFSRLDIAVTTPGLNIRKTILDYTEDDLDRVINLNIKGTVYFMRAFGRIMVDQRGGSLIACSSVRAVTIEPGLAVYGCTKAAIGLLVKGFASEVGRFGVRVNAIAPSIAETALDRAVQTAPGHL